MRQVQSVLSKISVCRTAAMGASWHWCSECDAGIRLSNSCGDRHCPQCRGATRAAWVGSAMTKIVDGVDYYQVVFTLPDHLSALALGNRRTIFNLLFHSAWKSLKKVVEDEQQYEAAASMVLHTWNQHLDAHVHVHAVVPGGGPSLANTELGGSDANRRSDSPRHRLPGRPGWKNVIPPPHERATRWWLVDADVLRHEFRKQFLAGLRRLHANGELKLTGQWSYLQELKAFEEFLLPMEEKSWVTYIQPPPTESSQPADIVKYLARYLTGGPISDARLLKVEHGKVTFTARTGTMHGGSDEVEDVELPAKEFVRRWCLHILPHGFTKTRCYGGWSNHHSKRYVTECRELCPEHSIADPPASPTTSIDAMSETRFEPRCPICDGELELIERVHRTSWRDIFSGPDCPPWNTFRETPG